MVVMAHLIEVTGKSLEVVHREGAFSLDFKIAA